MAISGGLTFVPGIFGARPSASERGYLTGHQGRRAAPTLPLSLSSVLSPMLVLLSQAGQGDVYKLDKLQAVT